MRTLITTLASEVNDVLPFSESPMTVTGTRSGHNHWKYTGVKACNMSAMASSRSEAGPVACQKQSQNKLSNEDLGGEEKY